VDDIALTLVSVPNPGPSVGHSNQALLGTFSQAPRAGAGIRPCPGNFLRESALGNWSNLRSGKPGSSPLKSGIVKDHEAPCGEFAGRKGIPCQLSGNAFDLRTSDQSRRHMATGSHDHISGRKPTWTKPLRGRRAVQCPRFVRTIAPVVTQKYDTRKMCRLIRRYQHRPCHKKREAIQSP
jgi:hypothetical protein